jgi:hypothetical protein
MANWDLLWLYIAGISVTFLCGTIESVAQDGVDKEKSKQEARIALLSPFWPVMLVWLLICHLREFGKIVNFTINRALGRD